MVRVPILIVGSAILDGEFLALDESGLVQALPGGVSLHNTMLPHWPDVDAFERASNAELKLQKLQKAVLIAIVVISAITPVQRASAQNYPTKPIRLIVPYPAGGGTDFFARLVGQKMSELVGQPIVVENKPGAATNLRADFVAKVPPDGYTMLLGDVATYAANPSLYKKLAGTRRSDI